MDFTLFCAVSFSASAATDLNGRENIASSLFEPQRGINMPTDGRTPRPESFPAVTRMRPENSSPGSPPRLPSEFANRNRST